jgi:hypothetical protein
MGCHSRTVGDLPCQSLMRSGRPSICSGRCSGPWSWGSFQKNICVVKECFRHSRHLRGGRRSRPVRRHPNPILSESDLRVTPEPHSTVVGVEEVRGMCLEVVADPIVDRQPHDAIRIRWTPTRRAKRRHADKLPLEIPRHPVDVWKSACEEPGYRMISASKDIGERDDARAGHGEAPTIEPGDRALVATREE